MIPASGRRHGSEATAGHSAVALLLIRWRPLRHVSGPSIFWAQAVANELLDSSKSAQPISKAYKIVSPGVGSFGSHSEVSFRYHHVFLPNLSLRSERVASLTHEHILPMIDNVCLVIS